MYASVLLCFGISQYFVWRGRDAHNTFLRAWTWLMLLPDVHHLVFAYGPYLAGPHGRLDTACIVHYAIQGTLTLPRL